MQECFNLVETYTGKSKTLTDLLHHTFVFRTVGGGVFRQCGIGIALKVVDNPAGDLVQV